MECEHAHDANGLRQGDIFAAHPGTQNWQDPWRRFGVIISADCDLAQGKTGPNLVYVPIVGLHTYLKDVWLPSQIEGLVVSCQQKLEKALTSARGKQISVRHAMAWAEEDLITELKKGKDIDQAALDKISEFRSTIVSLSELLEGVKPDCDPSKFQSILGQFFNAHEKLEAVQKPGLTYRRSVIFNALNGLAQKDRADTWPLIDIIGLDPEMREDEKFGFVIDMRRFSVMSINSIVLDRMEWVKEEGLYLRVCRLGPSYKMDFLQKFALLFTRIGLDDRRNVEQKSLFNAVSARLMPGE